MNLRNKIKGCNRVEFYTFFFGVSKLVAETFKKFIEEESKYGVEIHMIGRSNAILDAVRDTEDEVYIPKLFASITFSEGQSITVSLTKIIIDIIITNDNEADFWCVDKEMLNDTNKFTEKLTRILHNRLILIEATKAKLSGDDKEYARLKKLSDSSDTLETEVLLPYKENI